ncbi:hypothetical protein EfmAA610_35110 (plasmid) [Enterococcus faecium]|nr:hypothetical protein EfmAA610_35110 [Enterococcus faecium]
MNGSPLYSLLLQQKGIPGSFSYHIQENPTLYMIYQLQEKIRNFQKEPYFEGKAQVIAQNGAFDAMRSLIRMKPKRRKKHLKII